MKKHIRAYKAFIIIFIIFAMQNTQTGFCAENFQKLNLSEALELGTANNLDIKASRMDIDAAKNSIKASNRLQNPDFNVFYNYGQSGKGNPQQLGFSQLVELGKRGSRKNLAKSSLSLTEKNVELAEFNLRMDIRQAYVEFVAAKTVLKELNDQKSLLEELVRIAQKRVDAGAAPEMDSLQAQIALNQIVTQINRAKADVEREKYEFNKTLNVKNEGVVYDSQDDELPFGTDFVSLLTPEPSDKLPSFKDISDDAMSKRFDIKIAKQQIDVAQKNLSVVVRQRIPDLAILGGYGYQPTSHSDNGQFQNGAYAGASIVNIPIFYNYSPEIRNAKIDVEQAKLTYESAQNKAINDLNGAYQKFVTAQINLNYYDKNLLKKSKEMMGIAKRSYEVGKSNLTSLIVMEQSYKNIYIDYVKALSEYYNAWVEFLKQVNDEEIKLNAQNL